MGARGGENLRGILGRVALALGFGAIQRGKRHRLPEDMQRPAV